MTKRELLALLEPYGPDERVVFVDVEAPDGIATFEDCSVSKDHGTTRTEPDGSTSMPVAVYLSKAEVGRAEVMGGLSQGDIDSLRAKFGDGE